ncbi:thiamine biosynthesis lipoprotein [Lutibacter sp. Hel_I_33_5]|uniref:FAD:protein FMN transferase n=1 Tax=Lutibacter sp. Hel_I_33_5 TaxID=1566289 RepID=UPI0011A95BF5|nr:FAD:protein FMN transferase [Lutibacter sp. Hel_I_33_5]TVZ56045.1 thiamine biosynthesis lipoprotein [Lutibacter sp. Hel_I_33_5]
MKQLTQVLLLVFFFSFFSCKKELPHKIQLKGSVFGTTYAIIYLNDKNNYSNSLDSLFYLVNKSLSTYMPTSDISRINKGDTTIVIDSYFTEVFNKSEKIFKETNGYFDPTVGDLVNAWGFGPEKQLKNLDSTKVKDLLQFVGFNKVSLVNGKVKKEAKEIYFDFNSIAKGYGIDIVGRFLEGKKIENYIVEIGGEVRAKGRNQNKKSWSVGLDNPNTDGTRTLRKIINLSNKSMASSGNYRKFRIAENGDKFVHTINPKTGYAQESNLLSATVIAAKDCADVDAYATAFMAMGVEKTKQFLEEHKEIKAILIFTTSAGDLSEFSNYTQN